MYTWHTQGHSQSWKLIKLKYAMPQLVLGDQLGSLVKQHISIKVVLKFLEADYLGRILLIPPPPNAWYKAHMHHNVWH